VWQNEGMARGWESKDVESQVDENRAEKSPSDKSQKTQAQLNNERERQGLELSKKLGLADLESSTHPNHREALQAALAHLDAQLDALR